MKLCRRRRSKVWLTNAEWKWRKFVSFGTLQRLALIYWRNNISKRLHDSSFALIIGSMSAKYIHWLFSIIGAYLTTPYISAKFFKRSRPEFSLKIHHRACHLRSESFLTPTLKQLSEHLCKQTKVPTFLFCAIFSL